MKADVIFTEDTEILRLYDISDRDMEDLIRFSSLLSREAYVMVEVSRGLVAGGITKTFLAENRSHEGIKSSNDTVSWNMSPDDWVLIKDLLEGLRDSAYESAFQWLAGQLAIEELDVGPTSVLVTRSATGRW